MIKLSVSNIAWEKENDEAMYQYLQTMGIAGIEVAPTRLFGENPYHKFDEARKFSDEILDLYGLRVSSMQSIWYGKKQNLFGTKEEREELLAYTKNAILFAEQMNCENLVFGCPKNRVIKNQGDLAIAIDFFRELGEFAQVHNTVIALEANPAIYHTNFINRTEEAVALVSMVNRKGFLVNLDLGTMIQNEEMFSVLESNMELIHHIHISEPGLVNIRKRKMHRELKQLLEEKEYDRYVSIEMKSGMELSAVQDTIQYIREVFMG